MTIFILFKQRVHNLPNLRDIIVLWYLCIVLFWRKIVTTSLVSRVKSWGIFIDKTFCVFWLKDLYHFKVRGHFHLLKVTFFAGLQRKIALSLNHLLQGKIKKKRLYLWIFILCNKDPPIPKSQYTNQHTRHFYV